MDETHCQLVGSYAILKSAHYRSPTPVSDFSGLNPEWYSNIVPNAVLHVCPQALPEFVRNVLPTLSVAFKLLTNNSDKTLPDDYPEESETLLKSPLLLKWYAQNCVETHEKMVRIPIGLDYHSMRPAEYQKQFIWDPKPRPQYNQWGLKKYATEQEADLLKFRNNSKPVWDRIRKAYSNHQFTLHTRYSQDRKDAMARIPPDLVFYEPRKATRDVCWGNMAQYAFVVSPHGNGLDCHRTWEALCLGCIPIVKTSGLDPLFADLPVWIVQDWSDVSIESMNNMLDVFRKTNYNYTKLTLAYWKCQFQS